MNKNTFFIIAASVAATYCLPFLITYWAISVWLTLSIYFYSVISRNEDEWIDFGNMSFSLVFGPLSYFILFTSFDKDSKKMKEIMRRDFKLDYITFQSPIVFNKKVD